MQIEKFTISQDDKLYHAWPDVALTPSGKLVCVFTETTHHGNRDYSRVMLCDSTDRGRTWTPKRPLTEALRFTADQRAWWNCARITALRDGRLVVVVDRVSGPNEASADSTRDNVLFFSADEGVTWDGPHATPVFGIVPDRLCELRRGRWLLSAHQLSPGDAPRNAVQRLWYSDDQGQTWTGPVVVAESRELRLCEGNIIELPDGELVCFLRENAGLGRDGYKAISRDGGLTWDGPHPLPLPGLHRPTAGLLQDGRVMITYRFMHGSGGWGNWQNTFLALMDVPSVLQTERRKAKARIVPLDYDRAEVSDTGYTGWVQFPDGEVYVVNYIVDDAPLGQIRGYRLRPADLIIPAPSPRTSH
jgi:sialidase-1